MLAEIVLPAGTKKVFVRDIPELFATAIHPPLPENTPRQVKELKKIPLTEAVKNLWCGANGRAFPVRLNDDDWNNLANGCWKQLPPLTLPIAEADWQPYLSAFESAPPQDWRLSILMDNPLLNQQVLSFEVVEKYTAEIRNASWEGRLVPLSPITLLPQPKALGEWLLDCFVTVADLTTFAAQHHVGVRITDSSHERAKPTPPDATHISSDVPTFTTIARPLRVDPALLALDVNAEVVYHDNIGSGNGTGRCRAGQYRAEIEARIKRQTEGFFTVNESAQVLEDSQPGVDAQAMIRQMRSAFANGKLSIRNHGDRLPVLNEKDIRDFLSLVKVSDIDAWLESLGVNYRFPSAAPAESKLASEAPSLPHTAKNSNTKPGLDRNAILAHQWPLPYAKYTNKSLDEALSDPPDWLKTAQMMSGRKGKNGSATWNPALIAVGLIDKGHARENAFDIFFTAHFPEWLDEWNRCKENL